MRSKLGGTVLDKSMERLTAMFSDENARVVTKVSGGKDATVLMELSIAAARKTGRLPIDVVYHDEEMTLPGTNEYMQRVGNRTREVRLHWLYGYGHIENVMDRECPYWWTFDPLYDKSRWVTVPPSWATHKPNLHINQYINPKRFPAKPYAKLSIGCLHCSAINTVTSKVSVKKCIKCKQTFEPKWDHLPDDPMEGQTFVSSGHRADESTGRKMAVFSRGGWIAKQFNMDWSCDVWPIYDWTSNDVWKVINDRKLDYNRGYDGLLKAGIKRRDLRIVALTISNTALKLLKATNKAWPEWGEKVCDRIHGVRTALNLSSIHPVPRRGETWKSLFFRTCMNNAPEWIVKCSEAAVRHMLNQHRKHSGAPFPDNEPCKRCKPNDSGDWRSLVIRGYSGFPLCISIPKSPMPDQADFRPIMEKRLKVA